ncbi:MAG: lysophospholipid acyltransferase family protein [Atribacterota bacterium]
MIYYLSKYICLFFLFLFFHFRVSGSSFIPKSGPCLIVSNHSSYLDPVVIGCASPRRVYFVAKEELFRHPLTNFFLHQLGAFSLKRDEADKSAVRAIFSLLKQGKVVCLFPEGTRNSGQVREFRPGSVKLLIRAKVPVVVAGISGTYYSMPRGKNFPRPFPVQVNYAPPLEMADPEPEELAGRIRGKMEELTNVRTTEND